MKCCLHLSNWKFAKYLYRYVSSRGCFRSLSSTTLCCRAWFSLIQPELSASWKRAHLFCLLSWYLALDCFCATKAFQTAVIWEMILARYVCLQQSSENQYQNNKWLKPYQTSTEGKRIHGFQSFWLRKKRPRTGTLLSCNWNSNGWIKFKTTQKDDFLGMRKWGGIGFWKFYLPNFPCNHKLLVLLGKQACL